MADGAPTFVAECFWPDVEDADLKALDRRVESVIAEIPPDASVRYLGSSLLAAAVLPVLLVMATGCSSSPTKAPARTPGVVHQTPSQGPSSSAPAPAGADLSGTWSGQYSGAYTGTFTLTWRQSGSDLNGTIDLSTSGRSQIHGSVNGSSIRFGTVGSSAI